MDPIQFQIAEFISGTIKIINDVAKRELAPDMSRKYGYATIATTQNEKIFYAEITISSISDISFEKLKQYISCDFVKNILSANKFWMRLEEKKKDVMYVVFKEE